MQQKAAERNKVKRFKMRVSTSNVKVEPDVPLDAIGRCARRHPVARQSAAPWRTTGSPSRHYGISTLSTT
ncbi:hypothetical protein [Pandoraea terrigena]|uniref:hypothetical protein n=1 Tax=Pandoraea terrigena TaxID=2508292 RepID=UPI00123F1D4C|nr:hypothetical protein [Pandoraea terrigena]